MSGDQHYAQAKAPIDLVLEVLIKITSLKLNPSSDTFGVNLAKKT